MLKIGPKNIKTNVLLASLVGCADLAFRLVAREHGAGFCFYEMIDSNSLVHGPALKTKDLCQTHPKDLPIAAQILGSDPEIVLKGAKILLGLNKKITFLDLNAACPVKKVVKKRAGAYLLEEPETLYRIIDKLSGALPLPITVKLRIGSETKNTKRIVQIAKKCEQKGAKALFVHGRTRDQGYKGRVDYKPIKAIKENVKIPVIGSGDIFSPQKAKQMFDATGCDGILVARGAFGNPWIFKQIKCFLDTGELMPGPTLKEKLSVARKHLQYIEKHKIAPDRARLGLARKTALWYVTSFKAAAISRNQITGIKSLKELFGLIDNLLKAYR